MPDEDNSFGGSLENDDITCKSKNMRQQTLLESVKF